MQHRLVMAQLLRAQRDAKKYADQASQDGVLCSSDDLDAPVSDETLEPLWQNFEKTYNLRRSGRSKPSTDRGRSAPAPRGHPNLGQPPSTRRVFLLRRRRKINTKKQASAAPPSVVRACRSIEGLS